MIQGPHCTGKREKTAKTNLARENTWDSEMLPKQGILGAQVRNSDQKLIVIIFAAKKNSLEIICRELENIIGVGTLPYVSTDELLKSCYSMN